MAFGRTGRDVAGRATMPPPGWRPYARWVAFAFHAQWRPCARSSQLVIRAIRDADAQEHCTPGGGVRTAARSGLHSLRPCGVADKPAAGAAGRGWGARAGWD